MWEKTFLLNISQRDAHFLIDIERTRPDSWFYFDIGVKNEDGKIHLNLLLVSVFCKLMLISMEA